MPVSFKVTRTESALIQSIAERARHIAKVAGVEFDHMSTVRDLKACHANGTPLSFYRLNEADDFHVAHDVFGISQHINRTTGKLNGRFLPRCALPKIRNTIPFQSPH